MQPQTDIFNRSVADQEVWHFVVAADGLYAITITARCKNWLQNARRLFNDDDLAIQIDDYFFGELGGKKREFNTIGSWNGNELKNTSKTVICLVPLKAGEHKITFWTDKSPWLEIIEVALLPPGAKEFSFQSRVSVSAVDLVLKNVTEEKITVTNVSGAERLLKTASHWSQGIRVARLAKPGESVLSFIALTITDASILYKIGRVKLYRDITTQTAVNVRSDPSTSINSLVDLQDGAEVEILNEKITGEWIPGKSNIWHKVRYQGKVGFVLSSFVEIQGQEREKVIELITAKCAEPEIGIDANIMLAIAGVESHFKPYAVGFTDKELEIFKQNNNQDVQDVLGARGVFQLRTDAAKQEKVKDRFDWYQNIEGGVKYYKWIEQEVTKRGNVFEKRLIAWHDGLGNVPTKYNFSKLSGEMKNFVVNVQANIKKRNWQKIIIVPVVLLALWVSFGLGRDWFPVAYPVPVNSYTSVIEPAAASSASGADDVVQNGKSLVFTNNANGIKKIIVRENRNQDRWPITKLAYWSTLGAATAETLDGWLMSAGWRDGFFYVWREAGMHATPVALYAAKDGRLAKVRFKEKGGRTRDEIDAPVFLPESHTTVIRERQLLYTDVPHNTVIEIFKDFKYNPVDNIFYEFNVLRQETDLGND